MSGFYKSAFYASGSRDVGVLYGLCFKLPGRPKVAFSRILVGCVAVSILAASGSVHALFGKFMPLSLSGSVGYNYSYFAAGDAASETTSLTGTVNAVGYIWQPWFATTSAALTVGISNTETTSSSSDSASSSGTFNLSVFPRSRFPFSLNYSRSDSRIDSFSNATQTSDDSQYMINRLTLRQTYEGRATRRSIGSRTNFWYSTTDYDSETVQSESESMGVQYHIRLVPHNFSVTASRSTSNTSDSPLKPLTDVASLTHTYTPDTDMGVANLATTVKIDDGTGTGESTISQISSNFFWRPEHRSVNVSGGVRVSESETLSQGTSSEQKSLNSNLGMSYRLTRRINLGANMALGTTDTGASQSLTTTESLRLSYSSRQTEVAGFFYLWQWGINGSNSDTRVDDGVTETSTSNQSTGIQLGHSASRRWIPGKNSSVGFNVSQAGNMSKSSENDDPTKGINHSLGLSWNRRGRSGSLFGNLQVSDSRSSGQQESGFQYASASISQDMTISRLSSFAGTVGYTESRQKTVSDVPGASGSSRNRNVRANFSYRHDRPFGVYNMNFTSRLTGSKLIDSFNPETLWDWDSRFRYGLGLLDTSLSLRIIESAGGIMSKSLYFQATRSF